MPDGFFESTQVRETDPGHIVSGFKEASFSHAGGAGVLINGIFLNPYEAAALFDIEIESSKPVFVCRESDVTSAVHGDTLTISGTVWKIISKQPDGTGMMNVELSKD